MPAAQLLTSTQAGRLLGVSGRTVVRMAQRGVLEVAQKLPGPNGPMLFDSEVIQRKALELVIGPDGTAELELDVPERRAS